MNKSDLEKMQKCQEEYEKYLKESPLHSVIDEIANDIRDRQDNIMAMEFTRIIAELLRENGIVVHCEQHEDTEKFNGKSIEIKYGVRFDSVDCNKRDKKFTDRIAELEKECEEKKKEIDFLETQNKIFSKRLDVFEKNNLYENFDCKSVAYNDHKGTEFTVDNLIKAYRNLEEENERLRKSYDRHKRRICELESELSTKENLLKTKNGLCGENDLSGLTPIKAAELIIDNFKQGTFPVYETDYEGNIEYMDVEGKNIR